jgi:hypothetical protein
MAPKEAIKPKRLAKQIEAQLTGRLSLKRIQAELSFLQHIDSQPLLYTEPVVRRAIYRFDKYYQWQKISF